MSQWVCTLNKKLVLPSRLTYFFLRLEAQYFLHFVQEGNLFLGHTSYNDHFESNVRTHDYFSGVFPYVGMATMFIFCDYDWPRKLLSKFLRFTKHQLEPQQSMTSSPEPVSNVKKWTVTILILVYAAIQLFLPFSHFITKVGARIDRTNNLQFAPIWCCQFAPITISPPPIHKKPRYGLLDGFLYLCHLYFIFIGVQWLDQRALRLQLGYDGAFLG